MFSALRESSSFYILRKGENPSLQIGQVQSVSQPMTKFGAQPVIGQYGVETTVDISVKVGDEVLDFKQLPSNLEIANFGGNGVVVSESRQSMLSEIDAMLRNSRGIIDSVDYHKRVVEACEAMQKELNPELQRESERDSRLSSLEGKIGGMESSLSKLAEMVSKALGHTSENK